MRRAATLVVALVVLLAFLPAPVGRAEGGFDFYGSGWGHGLGMSQWGAYGLAKDGWGYRRILTHYYSRTKVTRARKVPSELRIGLTQGRDKIRLAARAGRVKLRVGRPSSSEVVGTIPRGGTWTVRVDSGKYRVLNGDGKLVGGRLWGGPKRHLVALYRSTGARVFVPETGHSYNRGRLEFNIYNCGGCSLRLIAAVPTERYLYGIAEVPSSWPAAALKAQAVAARTYALAKVARSGQHRPGCNCALFASTADQVYIGWDKEAAAYGEEWVRAVNGTKGEVVTFGGAYIQAFYSASSGGYTENNENVWGGTPIPYLRGVCDPGDYTSSNPRRAWSISMSQSAVTSRLALGIGTVKRFTNAKRGVSGRIITVKVVGGSGSAVISGTRLRSSLGLYDDRVWVNSNRNVTGSIRQLYDRLGCAPGLPTSPESSVPGGTKQRFRHGAIYQNRGLDLTAWVRGPIYGKYRGKSEANGVLGLPVAPQSKLTKPPVCKRVKCIRARFEGGHIYYREKVGVHELHGRVLKYYLSKDGPEGSLRFPTSDVRSPQDGVFTATFQGGTVTCEQGSPCTRS